MGIHIKVISSGSDGNAYLIDNQKDKLLIECGIGFNRLQKELWRLGASVSSLAGCLISHSHQ